MAGKAKVSYEQANAQGTTQTAGHKAVKVQCPKSRRQGRGSIKISE